VLVTKYHTIEIKERSYHAETKLIKTDYIHVYHNIQFNKTIKKVDA